MSPAGQQIVYYHSGHGQAENTGDKRTAAQYYPAVPAGKDLLILAGANAVFAADIVECGLLPIFLGGKYDLDPFFNSISFQQLADNAGHPAFMGFGNIRHPDPGGIQLGRRAHAGNDRKTLLPAALYQMELAGNVINGVKHVIIIRRQKEFAVFG
jgi:hypothetical protein